MLKSERDIIKLEDVWLGYKPGEYLVKSAIGNVREGEMIALVGRNGTGKSTLLRSISGQQAVKKGSIMFDDKPVGHYKPAEYASVLSFAGAGKAPAENMSVFEMVSLGRHPYTNWWGVLKESDKQKIQESLRFVGMESFSEAKVEHLSDGELQRVMIATALAQDTRVIILDEPTAFLDVPNKLGIAEVLFKLREAGKSVIFSTHDFDIAFNYADKLWVIHEKELIQGAPEDLALAHTFEHIFEDSGVVFDNDNLRFKRNLPTGKLICIETAEALEFLWTKRALERIGFTQSMKKSDAKFHLSISMHKGKSLWVLKESNTSSEFYSLYEMCAYLTQVK